MFRRKFGYESSEAPSFDDLLREDDIDVEVSCSGYGFSKEMENDLLEEYGIVEANDDDDCSSDEEEAVRQSNNPDVESKEKSTNYTESELESFRQQVEEEIQNATKKPKVKAANSNIQKYIASMSAHLAAVPLQPTDDKDQDDDFQDAIDTVPIAVPITTTSTLQPGEIDSDAASISSNDLNGMEDDDELADLDPNSRQYRFKMVEKILSDARSMRSYSTSASTIAPSVIKDKIKRNLDVHEKKEMRKRCVAKGEASAVTRGRKENRNTCKEYAGWDF